jgi:hypothetical protein
MADALAMVALFGCGSQKARGLCDAKDVLSVVRGCGQALLSWPRIDVRRRRVGWARAPYQAACLFDVSSMVGAAVGDEQL